MPFVTSSFLLLVVRPGAPSSCLLLILFNVFVVHRGSPFHPDTRGGFTQTGQSREECHVGTYQMGQVLRKRLCLSPLTSHQFAAPKPESPGEPRGAKRARPKDLRTGRRTQDAGRDTCRKTGELLEADGTCSSRPLWAGYTEGIRKRDGTTCGIRKMVHPQGHAIHFHEVLFRGV